MKHFICYSSNGYYYQQKVALFFAKILGKFDSVVGLSVNDLDKAFFNKNDEILKIKKGGGLWLWKPYVILKKLESLEYGEYLFYSDSAAIFLKPVDLLIKEMERVGQSVAGYELPLIEEQWTKKELFKNLKCNNDEMAKSNHLMAGFQLIKKTEFSINFYRELLKNSENKTNIDDVLREEQNNNFIQHRHDQSIYSLTYKMHLLVPFKDPTQYFEYPFPYNIRGVFLNLKKYKKEQYQNVIFLYRRGFFRGLVTWIIVRLLKLAVK